MFYYLRVFCLPRPHRFPDYRTGGISSRFTPPPSHVPWSMLAQAEPNTHAGILADGPRRLGAGRSAVPGNTAGTASHDRKEGKNRKMTEGPRAVVTDHNLECRIHAHQVILSRLRGSLIPAPPGPFLPPWRSAIKDPGCIAPRSVLKEFVFFSVVTLRLCFLVTLGLFSINKSHSQVFFFFHPFFFSLCLVF